MGRGRRLWRGGRPRLPFWVALGLLVLILYRVVTTWQIPPPVVAPGQYWVERVVDGDTLVIAGGQRVRLIGVNTPETKDPRRPVEPFGPEAAEFTRRHVAGRKVRLEFDRERRDRYDRILVYLYVGDWFLNEELIRNGLGRAELKYHYSSVMKRRFRAAEEEARRECLGIWSRPDAKHRKRAALRRGVLPRPEFAGMPPFTSNSVIGQQANRIVRTAGQPGSFIVQ